LQCLTAKSDMKARCCLTPPPSEGVHISLGLWKLEQGASC
jgi:hypothetical protein